MRVKSSLLAVLVAGMAMPSASAEPPRSAAFEFSAMIGSGKLEPDGRVWFKPLFEDVEFVLPPRGLARGEELWRIVMAANEANREVKVWYDAASGSVDEERAILKFPICSLSLGSERFDAPEACNSSPRSPKNQNLVLGWALLKNGSLTDSHALLDRALASDQSSRGYRLLALKTRAALFEAIGYREKPASEASDRAHVAALADFRSLAELEPDNSEHQLSIGVQLEMLGDYDGANAAYRQLMTKWPDEDFRATIRIAAVERTRGNFERALELVNSMADKLGPVRGMKFNYHRGWTLTKLGRYDEAIADLTDGLESQPDYGSAYVLRACARAQLGELKLALADVESATKIFSSFPSRDREDVAHDLARLHEVDAILRSAVEAKSNAPMSAVCDGYWNDFDAKRPRSPLLPPQV